MVMDLHHARSAHTHILVYSFIQLKLYAQPCMERVLAKQPVKNDQTKPELITNAKDFFHACSTSYFLCSVRFFFLISFTLSFVSVSVCCFSPHIFAFHAIIIVSCPWYFPFDDVRPYSVSCALYVSLCVCVREREMFSTSKSFSCCANIEYSPPSQPVVG